MFRTLLSLSILAGALTLGRAEAAPIAVPLAPAASSAAVQPAAYWYHRHYWHPYWHHGYWRHRYWGPHHYWHHGYWRR